MEANTAVEKGNGVRGVFPKAPPIAPPPISVSSTSTSITTSAPSRLEAGIPQLLPQPRSIKWWWCDYRVGLAQHVSLPPPRDARQGKSKKTAIVGTFPFPTNHLPATSFHLPHLLHLHSLLFKSDPPPSVCQCYSVACMYVCVHLSEGSYMDK